jgi:hypothetical protein
MHPGPYEFAYREALERELRSKGFEDVTCAYREWRDVAWGAYHKMQDDLRKRSNLSVLPLHQPKHGNLI